MVREFTKGIEGGQDIVDRGSELWLQQGAGFDVVMSHSPKEHQRILAKKARQSNQFNYHNICTAFYVLYFTGSEK